jgi:hypothetical protein
MSQEAEMPTMLIRILGADRNKFVVRSVVRILWSGKKRAKRLISLAAGESYRLSPHQPSLRYLIQSFA